VEGGQFGANLEIFVNEILRLAVISKLILSKELSSYISIEYGVICLSLLQQLDDRLPQYVNLRDKPKKPKEINLQGLEKEVKEKESQTEETQKNIDLSNSKDNEECKVIIEERKSKEKGSKGVLKGLRKWLFGKRN